MCFFSSRACAVVDDLNKMDFIRAFSALIMELSTVHCMKLQLKMWL